MRRFVRSAGHLLAALVVAALAGAGAVTAAAQQSAAPAPGGQGGLAARVIVTTSRYGLSPLSVLYSAVGAYYLRITYTIPCTSNVVILTARVSASSREVNLNGDDLGYVNEWSTQNGGGPSGQQIACGSGHITTNDFAPADWSGSGPVTITIGAIIESSDSQSATRLETLARTTLRFVDSQ